jgi:iron(III) transport system substrate-binding protein
MLMRYRRPLVAIALALTLTATACGGSPTASQGGGGNAEVADAAQQVYDRFNGLTGQERTDELLKAAKAEGELSVYTSNNDIEDVAAAFKDKYGLEVKTYRADSETVLHRVLQEGEANFHGADVLETNSPEMNITSSHDLLYPYRSEYRDTVRPQGVRETWTADRFNAFVVGWNTDLVKPGEEPKSFEDLASPRWRGKLAMELNEVDWYASLTTYWLQHGKTQEQIDELFNAIAVNSKLTKGHTATGELLSAGQYSVFISAYTQNIDTPATKGAPVSWRPASGQPVQPITLRPNGIATMKHASHPAAAILFTDFLLTDGQKVLKSVNRIPSVTTEGDPLAGLELIEAPEKDLLANSAEWSDRYQQVTSAASH